MEYLSVWGGKDIDVSAIALRDYLLHYLLRIAFILTVDLRFVNVEM